MVEDAMYQEKLAGTLAALSDMRKEPWFTGLDAWIMDVFVLIGARVIFARHGAPHAQVALMLAEWSVDDACRFIARHRKAGQEARRFGIRPEALQ